jgi:cell division ATPase FtsA
MNPYPHVLHAVLDVGATKVSALAIGRRARRAHVLGHGFANCEGAGRGMVADADDTVRAIRDACAQVERRARVRIDAVYASIAQPHAVDFGAGYADRLAEREALIWSIESAGLRVLDLVPTPLASAAATLSADEREHGVALIDLGARATSLAVYRDGNLVLSHVVDFGGADLTSSIAAHLGISVDEAEFLKCNVGCAASDLLDEDGVVAVPICAHGAGTSIERSELAKLIEGRLAPMWATIAHCLGELPLGAGVALTGGASLLDRMHEHAARALARPVRRANPLGLGDLPGDLQSPAYAAVVGLAQYVAENSGELGTRNAAWGKRRLATA